MDSQSFKTRFAPSPTGLLHLGNIRTALFNYLLARHTGGTFLLRLEDSDAMRGLEKYARALAEDLRWLSLEWNEGVEVGGHHGPYAQSERGPVYQGYFSALQDKNLAYPCFCSEHELAIARKTALAAGHPPRYSGRCRALPQAETEARLGKGEPATLRFRVAEGKTVGFEDKVRGPQVFNTDDIGDFVIRRSDGTPAFFFCNAIDDAAMEVTLVVRGEDHLTNTPRQIMLLQALGLLVPEYAHIALVVDADGVPLSKRTGSKSVQELRESGFLPLAINNYLARLGHTYDANTFMNLDVLAENFNLSRLGRAPARYDEAQLMHWQREAILHATVHDLWRWVASDVHNLVPDDKQELFVETIRANISFPGDASEWARIFFTDDFELTDKKIKEEIEYAPDSYFERVLEMYRKYSDNPNIFGRELPVPENRKKAIAFQLVRGALTNKIHGPELARLLTLMPKTRIEQRLEHAINLSKAGNR